MENQSLQLNNNQPSTIELKPKAAEIAGVLYHVNQLTSFPLTKTQIEDWAISLNSLYSNLDIDSLKLVIRKMKLGKIEWNYKLGIQNITRALESIGIEDDQTIIDFERYKREKEEFYNPTRFKSTLPDPEC